MSSSYQSSSYTETSSIYPRTISQDSVNPFLSANPSQFSQLNQQIGFRMQSQPGMTSDSTGSREPEIRKYKPISETKRDKKRY